MLNSANHIIFGAGNRGAAPVGATPYDIGTGVVTLGSYTSYDASAENNSLSAVEFNDDGTKMYTLSFNGTSVYQYTLSPAWDISSASWLQDGSITGPCAGMHFNAAGTKIYIAYSSPGVNSYLNSYDLSSAWNISTISDNATWTEITADDEDISGIHVSPDGTILHVTGDENDTLYQYALSPAHDESSATLVATMDISTLDGYPSGIKFDPTGLIMYVSGTFTASVYQIPL